MNTRFNPGTTGPLHIGHIYMALLNQQVAHSSGGKFVLRFDDNARHVVADHGGMEEMENIAYNQASDLRWMSIEPDEIVFQSEREEELRQFLSQSRFHMVISHFQEGTSETAPTVVCDPEISPREMCAWTIAQRVVQDRWSDIDTVIRGVDLLQNHALYVYFCALFGFRFPKCYYMPRLMTAREDISKTIGNWSIPRLRDAGYLPEGLREWLRNSCLINPQGDWDINNIKGQPKLIT